MNGAMTGAWGRVTWSSVKAYFFAGWREAMEWPGLSWLSLNEPVRLVAADGTTRLLLQRRSVWRPVKGTRAALTAIELPEDLVLRRSIVLPRLPDAELGRVVAQEVAKSSPFPGENTIFGFQYENLDGTRLRVLCVIAAKEQVSAYLESQAGKAGKHLPEVWAPGASGLRFLGFGEDRGVKRMRLRQWWVLSLFVLMMGLVAAILATPTAQHRLRAIQATRAFEVLQRASEPQVKLRDAFQNSGAKLEEATELLAVPVEPLHLIEDLSKLLSDDEWVSELRIKGNVVQIIGEGLNASKLLQTLGEQPQYKEVKAVGASVKNGNRESFSFEFKVAPVAPEAK